MWQFSDFAPSSARNIDSAKTAFRFRSQPSDSADSGSNAEFPQVAGQVRAKMERKQPHGTRDRGRTVM